MTFHDPSLARGGSVHFVTGPFGGTERTIELDRPMAIAEVIAAHGLSFPMPTIAVMDGEPVLRGAWILRIVRPGDRLFFVAVPRGGGEAGGSGKQLIGIIAAPLIGGWVASAVGSTLIGNLASAAVLVGGGLLLNALFPPPEMPKAAEADPVYSVGAASNQATPLAPVPVLYGRLDFAPRHASRPYAEYRGNDQYLYQLFWVTAGKADVTRIRIGETEAWSAEDGYSESFSDLQFQIVQPGQAVTLFPANVVTSSEVSGQPVPNPPAVLGPYVVNAAGTSVDRLAVDFAFPGGLWAANKRGVTSNSIALRAQYRRIDDAGDPMGGWSNLFAQTLSAATRTPQRFSREAVVAPGRYEVRFLADEAFDSDDGNSVNAVVWTGLRGYLTDFETPPDATLLAVKIRASEQLSQAAANQFRVTAERYLPVWNGSTWSLQKTRSIAWAAADMMMNSDYSLALGSDMFDLAQLEVLDATWESRGDTFNAIFDRSWTIQEALKAVLRAGRAQAVRMGGRIGFVRLEPKSIKRAVFSPRNVVRGSFRHQLVMFDEEKPDHAIGSFINETTWATEEVIGKLASVGDEAPQKIEWFGITDHDQAWRETVTEAAVNAYQREFVSFTAEWEGKLLTRGEPILVQHPFVQGVQGCGLVSRTGGALLIDVDPADAFGEGGYVILRGRDGAEWGPCLVASVVDRTVTLDADDLAAVEAQMGSLESILPGQRDEPAHVLLCEGELRPFNGLVVSATPSGSGQVDVLAVIDAPEVYLADATEVMPSPWSPPALPPQNPAAPPVYGLVAQLRMGIAQLELDAMWQPAAGAIGGYVAEVSYDDDSVPDSQKTWTPVYAGMANRFSVPVLPQQLVLRVAAIGVIQGSWTKRVFSLGEVPTILIPGDYLDVDSIFEEVAGEISEDLKWLSGNIRDVLDDLDRLGALVSEQDIANFGDRQSLRREIVKTAGEVTAGYIEYIEAAVGPGGAISQKLEGLYAAMGGDTAQVLVRMAAETTPVGVTARWGMQLSTDGETFGQAAFLVQVKDGDSEIILDADRTVVSADGGDTVIAVFDGGEGGQVKIRKALIKDLTAENIDVEELTATEGFFDNVTAGTAQIQNAAITSAKLANLAVTSGKIANLSVGTIQIADGAVTETGQSFSDSVVDHTFNGSMVATIATINMPASLYPPDVDLYMECRQHKVASGETTDNLDIYLEQYAGGNFVCAQLLSHPVAFGLASGSTYTTVSLSFRGFARQPGLATSYRVRVSRPGTYDSLRFFRTRFLLLTASQPKK